MKLLKLLPIFLLFLMNKTTAQTQASDGFADQIIYKNGSVVFGKILYYVPTDTLRFQLSNGQIMICPPSIIQKVVMVKPKTDDVKAPQAEKPYNFKEYGFYGSVAYAMSFGRDKYGNGSRIGVGLQVSAGHLFQRKLGIGGGLAYDSYYLKDGNANVIAAFGEVRGYLSKRRVAEFFTLAAGFGQPMKTNNSGITKQSGGLIIQPTIGLRIGASARYNFFVELGARFQKVHYTYSDQWITNEYSVTYQRWILRGGLLF
jgi:hypothetical protein